MGQDRSVYNNRFLVFFKCGCLCRTLERQSRQAVGKAQRLLVVLGVRCVLVVLVDNLHDEGDEARDENLAALSEIAPLFEKVDKLLSQVTFVMVVLEQFE